MKPWTVWFLVVIGLFLLPQIASAQMNVELDTALNDGFSVLFDLFHQEFVVFGVTIIVLVILFRNIFMAGLSRVPHIGNGPYASGIALSFSLLAVLGIVYMKIQSGRNVSGFLQDVLGPYGLYASIFLCVLLFIWLRHSLPGRRSSLFVAGLLGYSLGMMVGSDTLSGIGVTAAVFGIVAWVFGGNKGYSKYEGGSPSKPGLIRGMFGGKNKKEKQRAKDSVSLVKDQLASLTREEKLGDEITHIDDHVTELEKMRVRLESEEMVDLEKEDEILKQLETLYQNIKIIDRDLEEEEKFYQRAGSQEAARKIAYLKDRRVRFVELYKELRNKLAAIAADETRILKKEEATIEKEEDDIEKEYRDTEAEIKEGEIIIDDEVEIEKDVPSDMIGRDLAEEKQESRDVKVSEELADTFQTEEKILERQRNIEKSLEALHKMILADPSESNVHRALTEIEQLAQEKRLLEQKMRELQSKDRQLQKQDREATSEIKDEKRADKIRLEAEKKY